MTIECYFSTCKHHCRNAQEDGPFCYEPECIATEQEVRQFSVIRSKELALMLKQRIELHTNKHDQTIFI